MIARQGVASAAIRSIGHDGTDVCEVEMTSGAIYRYRGVDRDIFEQVLQAKSIGRAFHQHIRNGGFAVERVEDEGNGAE